MDHNVDKSDHDPNAMERGSGGYTNGNNTNRLDVIESEDHFRDILTKTMTLSPELFEKLYLNPKRDVPGDLRKRFANPTPLAIMGFSVAVFPLSIELMGWRGAGGFASATIACSIWFGGVLLFIAGMLEFILGNDFSFLVFMGYGAHIMTFGTTFVPWFNAVAFYSNGDPDKATAGFAASFGYYPIALGILSIIFLMGALRTNLIFVLIFVAATTGFGFAAAALFYTAEGKADIANTCLVGTGAGFFVADMFGWYLFAGMVIETMELPLPSLPVFDLTGIIKAKKKPADKME